MPVLTPFLRARQPGHGPIPEQGREDSPRQGRCPHQRARREQATPIHAKQTREGAARQLPSLKGGSTRRRVASAPAIVASANTSVLEEKAASAQIAGVGASNQNQRHWRRSAPASTTGDPEQEGQVGPQPHIGRPGRESAMIMVIRSQTSRPTVESPI